MQVSVRRCRGMSFILLGTAFAELALDAERKLPKHCLKISPY